MERIIALDLTGKLTTGTQEDCERVLAEYSRSAANVLHQAEATIARLNAEAEQHRKIATACRELPTQNYITLEVADYHDRIACDIIAQSTKISLLITNLETLLGLGLGLGLAGDA